MIMIWQWGDLEKKTPSLDFMLTERGSWIAPITSGVQPWRW